MSGTVWTKFFWADWQADPALRLCSYAARGLWMDMLCIAASHDPIGYVAVAGRGLSQTDIARMTGGSESEVNALIVELDRNGVFSRDRKGTIYSRRMVADAKRSAIARKNGKEGGNPSLSNGLEKSNPDNLPDKPPLKPHIPEAINQEPKQKHNREPDGFAEFWEVFPRKVDRGKAIKAYAAALKKSDCATLASAARAYAAERRGEDQKFTKYPASWLNAESWRNASLPIANGHAPPDRYSDEWWRGKLVLHKTRGVWPSTYGPPPTDQDCNAPFHLLVEYGYRQAAH